MLGNKMGRTIKFVGSIVFVVFIAAFYALLNIDLNDYKQQIETATAEATGRQLELEGDVSIAWSLIPTLVIEKARFSNAKWASGPEMLSLDKFEVRLALYPLLKREIQVTKILIYGPSILIETNKKGVGNWVFDTVSTAEPEQAETEESSSIQSVIVHEFDIEQAKIDYIDGVSGDKKQFLIEKLSVNVADLESPINVLLKAVLDDIPMTLDGELGGVTALLENTNSLVALNLDVGDVDIALNGNVAKPHEGKGVDLAIELKAKDSALSTLSGNELPAFGDLAIKGHVGTAQVSDALTLDLLAVMDDLDLLLKGQITKPREGKGVALDVGLKTDSAMLSLLSGSDIPPLGDISLKGHVKNDLKTDAVTLDLAALADGLNVYVKGRVLQPKQGDGIALDLKVDTNAATLGVLSGSEFPPVGEVTLSGALSGDTDVYQFNNFVLNAGKTDLRGDVRASLAGDKPNITATFVSQNIDLMPLEELDKAPVPESQSGRLFSDEPLVLEALRQFDVKVDIKVKTLESASVRLDKINVGIDLQNGHLNVAPLRAAFAGSEITGYLDLNAQNEVTVLDTKMQINGFKLAGIKALEDSITGGNTDVYFQAKGKGLSVRQIMAGLDGKAIIKVGESQIHEGTLDLLGADFFTELVGMLNPFSKQKKGTELACAVVNFNIRDGIATAKKGIAVQTAKLNIVGDGTVNLKNEKIKIGIKPEARTGIGVNISQLAGLIEVGGTLANPAAEVDEAALLAAGVSGAAAVATGGLSVVAQGLAHRGAADTDPCKTALGLE
jgi:uncharacterized protein involved in outer membrane biogenesis